MSTFPTSVPVDGNTRIDFVPAIANTASPTLAELNAGEAISKYFTGDGWATGGDQATIADDRMSEPQTFEQPGRESNTLTTRYVFNKAVPAEDEARLALTQNTIGYFVRRGQMDRDAAWAAEQILDEVWPVKTGVQRVLPPEANAVDRIEQRHFVIGPVQRFVTVAAA